MVELSRIGNDVPVALKKTPARVSFEGVRTKGVDDMKGLCDRQILTLAQDLVHEP